jgi:hypothetical protein
MRRILIWNSDIVAMISIDYVNEKEIWGMWQISFDEDDSRVSDDWRYETYLQWLPEEVMIDVIELAQYQFNSLTCWNQANILLNKMKNERNFTPFHPRVSPDENDTLKVARWVYRHCNLLHIDLDHYTEFLRRCIDLNLDLPTAILVQGIRIILKSIPRGILCYMAEFSSPAIIRTINRVTTKYLTTKYLLEIRELIRKNREREKWSQKERLEFDTILIFFDRRLSEQLN